MLTINAEKRKETGKSISRRLRVNNQFPGVLYGIDQDSILLILDHNAIFNLQKKIEFFQETIFLFVQTQKYIVKVQAIQRHSFKLKLLHIDFLCIK